MVKSIPTEKTTPPELISTKLPSDGKAGIAMALINHGRPMQIMMSKELDPTELLIPIEPLPGPFHELDLTINCWLYYLQQKENRYNSQPIYIVMPKIINIVWRAKSNLTWKDLQIKLLNVYVIF